jgi:hypothetical protein
MFGRVVTMIPTQSFICYATAITRRTKGRLCLFPTQLAVLTLLFPVTRYALWAVPRPVAMELI